jgi:pyruvate dehydrogenase E1 component alpha subunit
MAALWKLPLLFVCENNGWAEFSPTDKQFVAKLKDLAGAFGIPHILVNGNEVLEVLEAGETAVQTIRAGQGPFVLECITHRWRGHYEGDPQKYRDADEISALGENDPVMLFEQVMLGQGVEQSQIDAIRNEIERQIESSVEVARRGTVPNWETACHDVYAANIAADQIEVNHG